MVRSILNTIPPLVHILAGLLTPVWYYAYSNTPADWRVYLACAFFALLPDIDSSSSIIGSAFPFISGPIERRFGHRQITHSLIALTFIGLITYTLFPADWWILTAAYFSHLFIDMVTGTVGIPLLWPFQIAFYLAQIRPKSVGELILGIVIATLLLAPQAPTVTATIRNVAPQEEISFLPSPTPHTVTILIENVYSVESEILISQGDWLSHGDMIADLTTLRRMSAELPTSTPTLTPSPTQTSTPTPTNTPRPAATIDPFDIASAEQDLDLAAAIYQRSIATGTPNPIYVATLASFPPQIQDRQDCISREGYASDTGYRCNQELEQLFQQQARFATLAAPWQPDPLDVQVARQRYEDAQLVYEQRMSQLQSQPTPTPLPTNTPSPTQTATPTGQPTQPPTATATLPAEDPTRIRSLVTGRVLSVEIARITDNSATVEIIVHIGGQAQNIGGHTSGKLEPDGFKSAIPKPVTTLIPVQLNSVVDGDTIKVQYDDGRQETVRLLDLDTPETKHPTKPVECYGPEATAFTATTLCGDPAGAFCTTQLFIEPDAFQDRDRYDRLLAHLWFAADEQPPQNLNELLLSQGYARFNDFGNPGHHVAQYQAAEAYARSNINGIWNSCHQK